MRQTDPNTMIYTLILFFTFKASAVSAPFYKSPESLFASGYADIPTSTIEKVTTEEWARVNRNGDTGWVPRSRIMTAPEFGTKLGPALVRVPTLLKDKPGAKYKTIAPLKKLEKLSILNFAISEDPDENWVRVQHKNKTGFVELKSLLSSVDLAKRARLGISWFAILYHNNGWLETFRKERFGVAECDEFELSPRAIVLQNTPLFAEPARDSRVVTQLVGLENLELQNIKTQTWAQSTIPLHGTVWWHLSEQEIKPESELTTDEILARPLFDMATSRSESGSMIVSANGIYLSEDGKSWKKISQFSNANYPVAFSGDGTLFVGPYQSDNLGHSFAPFLKWDRVTQIIRQELKTVPAHLRMSDIRNRDEDKALLVDIEVGAKRIVQLSTTDKGVTWKFEGETRR